MGRRLSETTVRSLCQTALIADRLDTLEKIKANLPTLRNDLNDYQKLTQIYKFSFTFYRDPDFPGKNLGL